MTTQQLVKKKCITKELKEFTSQKSWQFDTQRKIKNEWVGTQNFQIDTLYPAKRHLFISQTTRQFLSLNPNLLHFSKSQWQLV